MTYRSSVNAEIESRRCKNNNPTIIIASIEDVAAIYIEGEWSRGQADRSINISAIIIGIAKAPKIF